MDKRMMLWIGACMTVLIGALAWHASASEARRLKGDWVWSNGGTGDLEAVFTPTGEHKWDVAFHFNFRDEDHTYSGTAEGDLGGGELKGRVQNEGKSRTWVFKGKFEGGKFSGTHAELRDDKEQTTGTLTLREPAVTPAS
jgi:hypothetical protein